MASNQFDIFVPNESATYPSWPLIFVEMTANMSTVDVNTSVIDDARVIDIYRFDSPNFGRHVYIYQIELDPAPTVGDPVRVYIDPKNRQAYVDPDSSHAQAGEFLQIFHPSTRWFDLLPRTTNWIVVDNAPDASGFTWGVRWRKAYSG